MLVLSGKFAGLSGRRRLAVLAAAAMAVSALAGAVTGAAPASAVTHGPNIQIAFQTSFGTLWQWGDGGFGPVGGTEVALAPGTSPSIAAFPGALCSNRRFQIAYHRANNKLGFSIPPHNGHIGTGFTLAGGTSPSLSEDGFIAFQVAPTADAPNPGVQGRLVDTRVHPNPALSFSNAFLRQGTSPSTVVLASGIRATAFQSWDGFLWLLTQNRFGLEDSLFKLGGQFGLQMADKSNPAIATDGGDRWKIAYRSATGNELVTVEHTGHVTQTGAFMAPGTSPSLAGLTTGGYELAFVGSDRNLWRAFPDTNFFPAGPNFTALPVAADTSPSVTALPSGGWVIAYQRSNGRLAIVSSNPGLTTVTDQFMAAKTSPSITSFPARDPSCGAPPAPGTGPHTAGLFMVRQPFPSEFIPYIAKYPLLDDVPPGRVLSIRFPVVDFADSQAVLVKLGRGTQECNNPDAVVVLNEGATLTPSQIQAIYGTAQPHFDLMHPFTALACRNGPGIANVFTLEITVQYD